MREWNVDLAISGPVDLEGSTLQLRPMKGDFLPFQTDVKLKRDKNGVLVTVIVRAETPVSAHDAALYFIGRAIDVLCLETDLPLHLSLPGARHLIGAGHVRAIIHEQNWFECFEDGRRYGTERSTYSRALSWFRKGHTSENPVDRLLAYWASIEVVGAKFARANERTAIGSVNKICDCFDQLWDACPNWKVIPDEADWVNKFCEMRNEISHGVVPLVEMSSIREISEAIPLLHDLALHFLRDWKVSPNTTEVRLAAT